MSARRRPWTLSTKLGAIGGLLLIVALLSIGLTLWVTWQLEGGAAAVNEAGRMRMQTWRLAQTLASDDHGRVTRFLSQFDESLTLLRDGDPARPLFVPRDERTLESFESVQHQWKDLRQRWARSPAPSVPEVAADSERFVDRIDDFVSAIESQMAHLTSILNAFQFIMVGLAIVSAVALLYSAYLFVFNPLSRLQSGLRSVAQGDLGARVEVNSRDEFGELSHGFNEMAKTLQELYQNLESKVEEKTLHIEAQRARLAALYEAAAFVARTSRLEELAQGFARQLRLVAKADGAALRWSDENNQRYVLLATDCLPEELVREENCLETGSCLCGQERAQASTRVIPIHKLDETRLLGHCHRAGYQTVMSIPVRLQERLVGEMNLFFRSAGTVTGEDRTLLETLASHLAGAIESLRSNALERENAVSEERSLLARELHDSIAQSLAFLKIQVGLLRTALRRRNEEQIGKALAELDAGVQESLADVRELLVHFRTRTNTESILPALQTTLRKFEHQTGVPTHFRSEGHGLPLDADVQIQVLHVVQEALSNIRKHAHASQVWVHVQQSPHWQFEVRDDGRGFVATRPDDETHVGLRIMRERAERIGALVSVHAGADGGTCVRLELPEHETLPA